MSGLSDYSGFEVIRAAMEVEKSGHHFYSEMSLQAHSEIVREIFSLLAQDEVQHLRTLEGLVSKYEEGAFWEHEDEFLPYLQRFREKEIFPSADRLQQALDEDDPDVKTLDLAIEAEEQFAEYFAKAAALAKNAEGREAFHWLSKEEGRHAAILNERKEKLLKSRE